jgi:hypothetical protein
VISLADFLHSQLRQITSPQFAINRKLEQRQFAHVRRHLNRSDRLFTTAVVARCSFMQREKKKLPVRPP